MGSYLISCESFLGCVDLRGTTWQCDSIATGFGGYLAQPLLRKALEKHGENMTEQQASELLDDCMRVLFYRDARSLNRVIRMFEKWRMTLLVPTRQDYRSRRGNLGTLLRQD